MLKPPLHEIAFIALFLVASLGILVPGRSEGAMLIALLCIAIKLDMIYQEVINDPVWDAYSKQLEGSKK